MKKEFKETKRIKFTSTIKRCYFSGSRLAKIQKVEILGIRRARACGSGKLVKVKIHFKPKTEEYDSTHFKILK